MIAKVLTDQAEEKRDSMIAAGELLANEPFPYRRYIVVPEAQCIMELAFLRSLLLLCGLLPLVSTVKL